MREKLSALVRRLRGRVDVVLPRLSVSQPVQIERVLFMDRHERKVVAEVEVERELRRPTVEYLGRKFACVRRAEDGSWIYREVTF